MGEKKKVNVGGLVLGGGTVLIQSMTNTDTRNIKDTLKQVESLREAGADIVRLSVYDEACVSALREIVKQSGVPIVADVHFDYRLAIGALEAGADKLRINPGNMPKKHIAELAAAAEYHGAPIRVGANSGSLPKEMLEKYGGVNAISMVESAMRQVAFLEKNGFYDIVISVKASSVPLTVESYRRLHGMTGYPLHVGVTEAGTERLGVVKSAVGIGALLLDGIGDTIRVSLTGDPVREVIAAKDILKSAGLYKKGADIIACPTCGRTEIDVEGIALELEKRLNGRVKPLKVAVMGCVVNGPGEARDADIGIAGSKSVCLLFKHGEMVRKLKREDALIELLEEIQRMEE